MKIEENFTEEGYSIECESVEPDGVDITFKGTKNNTLFSNISEEEFDEILSFLSKVRTVIFKNRKQ